MNFGGFGFPGSFSNISTFAIPSFGLFTSPGFGGFGFPGFGFPGFGGFGGFGFPGFGGFGFPGFGGTFSRNVSSFIPNTTIATSPFGFGGI